jgi:hypothetical protein
MMILTTWPVRHESLVFSLWFRSVISFGAKVAQAAGVKIN